MVRPLALSAYLGATRLLEGWAERRIEARVEAGKEDAARLAERFGHGAVPRPDGPLVWFHAASVGESLSILELIRRIGAAHPGLSLLVTTGTRTSAQLLAARLPEGVIHHYVPVDTRSAVTRFLDHWHPDLALWTESELWPRLVTETAARGTPMLLINARISEASARRWRWLGRMSAAVVGSFDAVLVQDDEIKERFALIGTPQDKITVTGSLKEGAAPLPVDQGRLAAFQKAIGDRPVWLAASTHDGEESEVIAAQQLLLRRYPNLLMILAPRHPERGGDVAEMLDHAGLAVAQRSEGAMPGPEHKVYLADSLGEMGLWYRLAPFPLWAARLRRSGGTTPMNPRCWARRSSTVPIFTTFRTFTTGLSRRAERWE